MEIFNPLSSFLCYNKYFQAGRQIRKKLGQLKIFLTATEIKASEFNAQIRVLFSNIRSILVLKLVFVLTRNEIGMSVAIFGAVILSLNSVKIRSRLL